MELNHLLFTLCENSNENNVHCTFCFNKTNIPNKGMLINGFEPLVFVYKTNTFTGLKSNQQNRVGRLVLFTSAKKLRP